MKKDDTIDYKKIERYKKCEEVLPLFLACGNNYYGMLLNSVLKELLKLFALPEDSINIVKHNLRTITTVDDLYVLMINIKKRILVECGLTESEYELANGICRGDYAIGNYKGYDFIIERVRGKVIIQLVKDGYVININFDKNEVFCLDFLLRYRYVIDKINYGINRLNETIGAIEMINTDKNYI